MNDKDRDRCSDGAGPSDLDDGPSCCSSPLVRYILIVFILLLSSQGWSKTDPDVSFCLNSNDRQWSMSQLNDSYSHRVPTSTHYQYGLSLSLDAGILLASDCHANFYQGIESNVNSIYRIMHSEAFGMQMWNDLTTLNLIGSDITNYQQLSIDEYGEMSYRMALQVGMGFRYDYGNGWGWIIRMDYAKLTAVGVFMLNATNGTGILTNQDRWVRCGIVGQEKRINIDLGISRKFKMQNGLDWGLELGGQVNNTEVLANDIEVAGRTYSILDIWNGQFPSASSYAYDYINQGGIGYGAFATLNWGYTLPSYSTLTLAYTLYYNRINLEGYEMFAPQHVITLRFDFDGFKLFDS